MKPRGSVLLILYVELAVNGLQDVVLQYKILKMVVAGQITPLPGSGTTTLGAKSGTLQNLWSMTPFSDSGAGIQLQGVVQMAETRATGERGERVASSHRANPFRGHCCFFCA